MAQLRWPLLWLLLSVAAVDAVSVATATNVAVRQTLWLLLLPYLRLLLCRHRCLACDCQCGHCCGRHCVWLRPLLCLAFLPPLWPSLRPTLWLYCGCCCGCTRSWWTHITGAWVMWLSPSLPMASMTKAVYDAGAAAQSILVHCHLALWRNGTLLVVIHGVNICSKFTNLPAVTQPVTQPVTGHTTIHPTS